MRCRQCDYALWDLPSRKCPECGTPFKPSEYEFTPGTVQYLCPHCRQCYYGTNAKGHLWPRSFTCVKCNRPIEMDQMLLIPAEGWSEEQTSAEKLPWLNRGKIGFFKGYFKTAWMAMTRPSRVMQLLPTQRQASGRMAFALMTNMLVCFVALVPFIILQITLLRGAGVGGGVPSSGARIFGMGLGFLLIALLGTLIAIVLGSLVTHAVVRLTGRTQGTFNDTFSVFCYSTGANLASAVPCLGMYAGWIWWLISSIFMLRERHKIHGGRAALAVCSMPVLAFASFIGLGAMVAYTAPTSSVTYRAAGPMGNVPYAQGPVAAGASAETQTKDMWYALREYADKHNGSYPRHAIMLGAENLIDSYDFVGDGTPTSPKYVLLDDNTNLLDFYAMDASEQARVARKVIRAMPKDVVAHRIGDYVFTYHGVDKVSDASDLWLLIRHVPKTAQRTLTIYIATDDGEILNFSEREFTPRLKQQNALRAAAGLPPLPHPDKLTHDSPFATDGDDKTDASPQQ